MAEDCNDTITITYLPPDVKEYLISYRNEAIASTVLEGRIDKPQFELPLQENEKNNTIEPMENDQNAKEKASQKKYAYERIASMEQPSFKIFGFEFAPLFIPLERRLQTVGAVIWISLFLFFPGASTSFLLYCLFSENYKWITLLYGAWCVYDWNTPYVGGRRNKIVRNLMRKSCLWRYFSRYFPIKLVKTTDLDPTRSYLFGSHPHGILCAGAFTSFATDALGFEDKFPGLEPHLLALQGNYWFFGFREVVLASGACAATKEAMEYLFRIPSGKVSVLVVGGALEALEGHQNEIRLIINRRKGFIKLALRYGVDLVPTFSFGEQAIYTQAENEKGTMARKFQEWVESWAGFTPAFFMGRGIFQYSLGIVPHRHPITVVTGSPIEVKKVDNPTSEDINGLHQKYVEALKKLYATYNPIYGDDNIPLVIT